MMLLMTMIFAAKSEKKSVLVWCYGLVSPPQTSLSPSPLSANDPNSSSHSPGVFGYTHTKRGRQKRPFARLASIRFYSLLYFIHFSVSGWASECVWHFLNLPLLPYLFSKFTVITSCEIHFVFGWVLHIIMCCYFVCVCVFAFDCAIVCASMLVGDDHQRDIEYKYSMDAYFKRNFTEQSLNKEFAGVEFTFEHNQRNCANKIHFFNSKLNHKMKLWHSTFFFLGPYHRPTVGNDNRHDGGYVCGFTHVCVFHFKQILCVLTSCLACVHNEHCVCTSNNPHALPTSHDEIAAHSFWRSHLALNISISVFNYRVARLIWRLLTILCN